ncbi:hypothetical protein Q9L58_004687 [Maublancomyces gigas]|uniref:Uncharacterized protein n=1 Tax=Discina gigas TaxID=1032678 RepID=A0ABR3GKL0_9PEZI
MVRQELREAQRDMGNKLREVAEKWQLEIHMENIRTKGSNMSVVFRPLELPPMVEVRTGNYDCVTLKEDVVSVNEVDFLKIFYNM